MSSTELAILRNCLGNLYAAVKRFGPIDADIQFAMREAGQALGPPYSELETGARLVTLEPEEHRERLSHAEWDEGTP